MVPPDTAPLAAALQPSDPAFQPSDAEQRGTDAARRGTDAGTPVTHQPEPTTPGSITSSAVLSQAPSENFPVASRVLPAAVRRHLMALYGFARLTDDIGDEAVADRPALLDWLEAELGRAALGRATHPLMTALTPTLVELDLPLEPFEALIDANRQDQVVRRYQRFEDLVGYCMLSAAPVGRLVLAILGRSTPERTALADDVCVGLQVVEHLQDVAEDLAQDRIYLPLDDLRTLGCDEADLGAPEAGPALRRVVALECRRARHLLRSGAPLAASLPLRERVAVAGFTAGGLAALDAIERARFDVLGHAPRPSRLGFARRLVGVLAATTRRHRTHGRAPRP